MLDVVSRSQGGRRNLALAARDLKMGRGTDHPEFLLFTKGCPVIPGGSARGVGCGALQGGGASSYWAYSGVPTTQRGAAAVVVRPPGITGQPLAGTTQEYAAYDPGGRDLQPCVDLVDTHGPDAIPRR
jgi:hypothetical protein